MSEGVRPPMTIGRFSVEEQEFWTECECPDSLCTHGSDRMRPYYEWIVWDLQRAEHAWITFPSIFAVSYGRKRDAINDARRADAQAAKVSAP